MRALLDVVCFVITIVASIYCLYSHIMGPEDTKILLKKLHCPLKEEVLSLIAGIWMILVGFIFGLKKSGLL